MNGLNIALQSFGAVSAQDAGRLVGKLLVYVAIIALIVWLIRKSRNKNKKG